jgi:hypothetical protein
VRNKTSKSDSGLGETTKPSPEADLREFSLQSNMVEGNEEAV